MKHIQRIACICPQIREYFCFLSLFVLSFSCFPLFFSFPIAFFWPSLKSALRPTPSALAESANFRPFYVKGADFSPPPHATKKRRELVKTRPCCPHLATKKKAESSQNPPLRWVVDGGMAPPPFCLNLILSSKRSK